MTLGVAQPGQGQRWRRRRFDSGLQQAAEVGEESLHRRAVEEVRIVGGGAEEDGGGDDRPGEAAGALEPAEKEAAEGKALFASLQAENDKLQGETSALPPRSVTRNDMCSGVWPGVCSALNSILPTENTSPLLRACMAIPTHSDPVRHTAQAMTIPKVAVGRNHTVGVSELPASFRQYCRTIASGE